MAAVRIVYVGGGSTRAPGTVAAFVERGVAFAGCDLLHPTTRRASRACEWSEFTWSVR